MSRTTDYLRAAIGSVRVGRPPPPVHDLALLTQQALAHGIPGYVARALRGDGVESPGRLAERRRAAALTHLRTAQDLRLLATALGDIPHAVLKGPVVVAAHGEATLRDHGDLDVLVRPQDVRRTMSVLEASGTRWLEGHWPQALADEWAEFPGILPSGGQLDLHWHVANHPRLRSQVSVDADVLLRRSRPRRLSAPGRPLGGAGASEPITVPGLDPVDHLVHLCVHAATSGGHRLQWLKDIAVTLDWTPDVAVDEVVERAGAWGVPLLVTAFLDRVAAELGTGAPSRGRHVPRGADAWRWVLQLSAERMDAHRPVEAPCLPRALLRATRADMPSSLRELIHRTVATRRRVDRTPWPVDPLHRDADTAGSRARVLDDLGAQPQTDQRWGGTQGAGVDGASTSKSSTRQR